MDQALFSLEDAARLLGGISPWTLRRHVPRGNLRIIRLGKRIFVSERELRRVQREGLPRLTPESRN